MMERGYKHTEVGIIPTDWEVETVRHCTTVVTGATPSTKVETYWGGNIRWMNSGELNNKIIADVEGRITQEGYDSCGTHIIPTRCVLIGLAGQGKTRGTAAYNLIPLCTNQSIASIKPNDDIFDSKYLYYFFDGQYNNLRLMSSGDGGRGGLNKEIISNIQFPLPSLDEQKSIATALSDIDTYLTTLEAAIAKKRLLKQGSMQQLLTGKTRLPGFTDPWVEKTIGDIGRTYNGITGKSKEDFGVGEAKYVTFLNILNNPTIDPNILERVNISPNERQNAVLAGDLFFNTSSETSEEVGICATIKNNIPDLYLNSFCFGYRLIDKEMSSLYLSYYFRSSMGRAVMTSLAQGATRYNLSKGNFNKIVISVPSTIKEQEAISLVLTTMDDEIAALQREHTKYTLIKQGMMQKLLTGQIRLPQPCQSQE